MFKLTMHIAATLIIALPSSLLCFFSLRFEKYGEAPLVLAAVYLAIVVGRASNKLTYREILDISLAASILANIFYELLASFWLPGMINYIPFLSLANVIMYLMLVSGLAMLLFVCFASLKCALAHTLFRKYENR